MFLIVIDNFRYDQWRMLAPQIGDLYEIDEDMYTSILPTATQYARNAIFSGLMPTQIATMFPDLWVDEDEEEGKNLNEEPPYFKISETHYASTWLLDKRAPHVEKPKIVSQRIKASLLKAGVKNESELEK